MSADTHTEVPRATPKITKAHTRVFIDAAKNTYKQNWEESYCGEILANLQAQESGESVLVPAAELRELRNKTAGTDGSSLRDVYLATEDATSRWLGYTKCDACIRGRGVGEGGGVYGCGRCHGTGWLRGDTP